MSEREAAIRFQHSVTRYTFPIFVTALVTAVSLALPPVVEGHPSPPFLLAVLVVAWIAGFGPAVLTCVLSIAALDYFFVPPLYSVSAWHEFPELAGVMAVALAMAWLAVTRRRSEEERARLLADAERSAERLRHVQAVIDTTIPHTGFDELLKALLDGVRIALKSDTATVLLLSPDGLSLRPIAWDGAPQGASDDVSIPVGTGIAGTIAASEAGLIFDDIANAGVVSEVLRDGARALIGVPLRVGRRLIGVIHVGSSSARRYTQDDLLLLRLVADRAALAIERTRLTEAALEGRAAAEAANREKDEFLAVLGHEFRNPLSAITAAVRLLERPGTQEETTANAGGVIARQARHLSRLVDDLLQANRVMAGKVSLAREVIDLSAAVRRCVSTLSGAGRLERHVLKVEAEPVWADADPVRLDQIILNLLDNAVKYTPPGSSIWIVVRGEGQEAVLEVRDRGLGIRPELLARIFEPFVQGDAGSRRGNGGLGLGLSVVRRLVEMHGGTVRAASDGPGRGSRFTVRLPRVAPPRAPDAAPDRHPRPLAVPRRILIVEDDADTREMLRCALESFGHEVHDTDDAERVLDLLLRVHPEVVLVDIGLPAADGYEVARRIRATPQGEKIRLVAITGYGASEDRARSAEAGFDRHLTKPVDPAVLVRLL